MDVPPERPPETGPSLESIEVSVPKPDAVPAQADQYTQKERSSLDDAERDARLQGILQDISERKKYAGYFFFLACAWVVIIISILLLQGFGAHFKLSEPVILALIGSTTVNILGILYVVANYLFPKH
jgi:hypothetical protein